MEEHLLLVSPLLLAIQIRTIDPCHLIRMATLDRLHLLTTLSIPDMRILLHPHRALPPLDIHLIVTCLLQAMLLVTTAVTMVVSPAETTGPTEKVSLLVATTQATALALQRQDLQARHVHAH